MGAARELSLVVRHNLEGRDGGGEGVRVRRVGIYVYTHFIVQKKPM